MAIISLLFGAALLGQENATSRKPPTQEPPLVVELQRAEFQTIDQVPVIRLKIKNPSGRVREVRELQMEADPDLHLGEGIPKVDLQISPGEERDLPYTGNPGPTGFARVFHRAVERRVVITLMYVEPTPSGEREKPEYSTLTIPMRPRGAFGAILGSSLLGMVFLLVFRWFVNAKIRCAATSLQDYVAHGVMGFVAVTGSVMVFTVAPEKFEGLGISVQPFDFVGGFLLGLSFSTLSTSFIALLAPPGANPVLETKGPENQPIPKGT